MSESSRQARLSWWLLPGLLTLGVSALLTIAMPAHGTMVGKPLAQILDEYRRDGLALVYSTDLVAADMVVASEPAPQDAERALRAALAPFGLGLERAADVLLVVQLPRSGPAVRHGTIAGVVRDGQTGRRIPGAGVVIHDAALSTVTRSAGDFSLREVRPGRHAVRVQATGYSAATVHVDVRPGITTVESISLGEPEEGLEKIVVSASQYRLRQEEAGSYSFLGKQDLEQLPDLAREPMRAVSRLPGTTGGVISARPNIRGGEADETVMLFDGLPLYEPFHQRNFQEAFSVLDSRVVGGMEVFTGGFPAQYGDRLSGVVDIRPVEPTENHHELFADFFNMGGMTTGRFADGRGHWLVSGRRGNLEIAQDAADADFGTPSYYDAVAQIDYAFSDSVSVSFNGLVADDDISLQDSAGEEVADADYQTLHVWAAVEHRLNPSLAQRTMLAWVGSDNKRTGRIDEPEEETMGGVRDYRDYAVLQLKQDWTYSPSERYLARWGFDVRHVEADYDYDSDVIFFEDLELLTSPAEGREVSIHTSPDGQQYGLYFSNRVRLGRAVTAELGLRWDRQTYTTSGGDDQLSPRVSVMYQLAPATSIRASWGRFYQAQGVQELQVQDGVSTYFEAQRSDHAILGFDHRFPGGIALRVEGYRKDIRRLRPRFENLFDSVELLPELQADRVRIDPDKATSQGLEVLLSGALQKTDLSWWVSVVRSRVEDRVDGRDVPRSWDQRDALALGLSWKLGRWDFSLAGRYQSGWPTTEVFLEPGEDGEDELMLGERNADRLPAYRTIDVRIARRQELKRGALTLFVEATNLLDQDNPCCVGYDEDELPDGTPVLTREYDDWLPRIPSAGFIWEF